MARILVSMPDKFLNQVDEIAEGEQRSRSELVREALRTYIKRTKLPSSEKAAQSAQILDNLLA